MLPTSLQRRAFFTPSTSPQRKPVSKRSLGGEQCGGAWKLTNPPPTPQNSFRARATLPAARAADCPARLTSARCPRRGSASRRSSRTDAPAPPQPGGSHRPVPLHELQGLRPRSKLEPEPGAGVGAGQRSERPRRDHAPELEIYRKCLRRLLSGI